MLEVHIMCTRIVLVVAIYTSVMVFFTSIQRPPLQHHAPPLTSAFVSKRVVPLLALTTLVYR